MSQELTVTSRLPVLRGRGADPVGEVISAFESDTAAVFVRTAPISENIISYTIILFFVVAIGLAAVVKLDQVVTSVTAMIKSTAGFLYVSPLNPSVVKQVNVRVNQIVKKGQALATLDPTFTEADLVEMKEHMASDVATVNREEAELANRPFKFSNTDRYEANQGEIYLKRQAQYHSDLASFDGQIASAQAQMTQALSDAHKYTDRLKLASEAENVYTPLLDKGYVSKLQVLTATDNRTEMSRLLADAQNQIAQYKETSESLKAQRQSYIHKWYSDTATQLVLDRNDLVLTRDSLDKDQKLQDLTSLDSPDDAIVFKIGKLSKGSVAPGNGTDATTPGTDPLFTLVPLSAPLEAELNIVAADVGFIRVGDPVQLKLDAYPYIRFGTALGVVKSISEGSYSVDDNNTPVSPYFKVRVTVKKLRFHNVERDFRLIPGMTLVGDIMVGKRTILSYLIEGLLRNTAEAMREP